LAEAMLIVHGGLSLPDAAEQLERELAARYVDDEPGDSESFPGLWWQLGGEMLALVDWGFQPQPCENLR
jgi:hypothetical protein